ncbi:hypothetical protein N9Q08_05740 [Schleiferiaceae bacterium]|nr:hypothetical protein [Schleiferiaceae bacterium]
MRYRLLSKKLVLVDFDFTLVNNHFDWINRRYINGSLEFDTDVLEIIQKESNYLPIIFTARGIRSKKYIHKYTPWQSHFYSILNCGNTGNKLWLIHNCINILFTQVLWIDDLRDVDFNKATFTEFEVDSIPENIQLVLWRK